MASDAELREWLEKLVSLQEDFAEAAERLNEAKREARSDGVDLDVINALLPVFVKHRHDKGLVALQEMARYARVYGAAVPERIEPSPRIEAQEPSPAEPAPEPVRAGATPAPGRRPWPGVARASMQAAVAVSVAAGLLWLLS